MHKDVQILLLGAGSIGERHIRNLWHLGYKNITVYRQRNLPFRDIGEAKVAVCTNWSEIEKQKFFASFICTPTSLHAAQAIACLQLGMHVFVEKPLAHNLEKFNALEAELRKEQRYFHVGYMLHFHPFLRGVFQYIADGTFGKLRIFETTWHSYLPDWHPWEDYKMSYAARKELGGGAALTLCHDVDLMLWMCGAVKQYQATFLYDQELDLKVDTGAVIQLEFASAKGACHISFSAKQEKRLYSFVFDDASVEINYLQSEMRINKGGAIAIQALPSFKRNELFISEVQDFFSRIGKSNYTTADAINTLEKEKTLISICNPEIYSQYKQMVML